MTWSTIHDKYGRYSTTDVWKVLKVCKCNLRAFRISGVPVNHELNILVLQFPVRMGQSFNYLQSPVLHSTVPNWK